MSTNRRTFLGTALFAASVAALPHSSYGQGSARTASIKAGDASTLSARPTSVPSSPR